MFIQLTNFQLNQKKRHFSFYNLELGAMNLILEPELKVNQQAKFLGQRPAAAAAEVRRVRR